MYQYTYRTTEKELWQLSMYYMYGSMVGVCNIIFTLAVMILSAVKWNESGLLFRSILVLGMCLFTVLQPIAIWRKAKKQAASITEDTSISFNEYGIQIRVGEVKSDIPWKKIHRVSKKPAMMVIFTDTTHGYVLTNRVVGRDRKELYEYIISRMNR